MKRQEKKLKKNKEKIRDAIATKNDILDAAIEVFVHRGFVKATLEQIACKANVTRGAVYWHFENKYDIFEALHDKLHQPLTSSILADLEQDCDNSLTQLEKLCTKLLIDLAKDESRKKILTIFFCKCDYSGMDKIVEKQRTQKLKNINLFAQYFEKAKKAGLLESSVDAKTISIALACYLSGIVSEYLRNPQLFNLEKQAKMLVKQFFDSLR